MRPSAYGVAHLLIPLASVPSPVTACTANVLGACAEPSLNDGPSLFGLGIRTVGATGQPALPEGVNNPMFCPGGTSVPPVSANLTPLAKGRITLVDASPWERLGTGNPISLSAITNFGGGRRAGSAPVGGIGQSTLTCGAGQFATIRFTPTAALHSARFGILNMEAVGLPGASCCALGNACVITSDVTNLPGVPSAIATEPATSALLAAGLVVTAESADV